jgi:DNA polymerase-3 subunit alpha (Gram-positive type)
VARGRDVPLADADIVVVDLETTGLVPIRDQILEIGAVRIAPDGAEQDSFHTMVRFDGPIPPEVAALTGIRPEMLQGAPTAEEALARFWQFVRQSALAAHNADFDLGFLRVARGGRLDHAGIDTLALARALYPELKNHRLETVAQHLGVRTPHARPAVRPWPTSGCGRGAPRVPAPSPRAPARRCAQGRARPAWARRSGGLGRGCRGR